MNEPSGHCNFSADFLFLEANKEDLRVSSNHKFAKSFDFSKFGLLFVLLIEF